MRTRVNLSLPEFGFVVMTRGVLGAGIGLLASEGLRKRARRRLGAALMSIGVLTTPPALYLLFRREAAGGDKTPDRGTAAS